MFDVFPYDKEKRFGTIAGGVDAQGIEEEFSLERRQTYSRRDPFAGVKD